MDLSVYKLFRADEWARARAEAIFKGSDVDAADGFMHFSTAAQVRETAAKHFAGTAGLVLAQVDPGRLPRPLVWEPFRGGQLFPHLYDALPWTAVVRHWPLPLGPDGGHVFPVITWGF